MTVLSKCVWNIWIDVKLLTVVLPVFTLMLFPYWIWISQQGRQARHTYLTQRSWYDGGRVSWSFTCTCRSWHGCRGHSLQDQFDNLIYFCWYGNRLSQAQNRHDVSLDFLQFPMSISSSVRFSQSVKWGAIWFCWQGRVCFQFIPFSTSYGDGSFHCFSGPFSDLLLSGERDCFCT